MSTTEVISRIRTHSTTFTRVNDTNAYTAGDVMSDSTSASTIMRIRSATKGEGAGTNLMSILATSSASVATKPDILLWFFDKTVALDNDNAAFTPTDAEMLTLLQVVRLPAAAWIAGDATSGAGGNAFCNAQGLWLPINTVQSSDSTVATNDIFVVATANAAYTPVASEIFNFRFGFVD